MKIITIFFLAASFCCFQNDTSTKEIIEKANRIRIELLSSKSLPTTIQRTVNQDGQASGINHDFYYYISRHENNIPDSVLMLITVFDDALEHIQFTEMQMKDGNGDKSYSYKINKYGEIDWAYYAESSDFNSQVIEINTDSANYIPKFQPIKNPDEKTMAFYTTKLIVSLDKLDKILFPK